MAVWDSWDNWVDDVFESPSSEFSTETVSNYDEYQQPIWENLAKSNPYYGSGSTSQPTKQQYTYQNYLDNYQGATENNISRYFDPTSAIELNNERFSTLDLPAYQRDVMPLIDSQYNGPGYWGTARADAQATGLQSAWETSQAQGYEAASEADSQRYAALQALLTNLPQISGAAADYSNMLRSPTNDPYYQEALKLLGLSTQTTLGGTTSDGGSLGYSLVSGLASGAGQAVGSALTGG